MFLNDQQVNFLVNSLSQIDFDFPDDFISRADNFFYLLSKWNSVHNLTSLRDVDEQIRLHLLDCVSVLPEIKQQNLTIADIGSGAGFPGIIWAISNEKYGCFLVEANKKKAAFLSEVVRILKLKNVKIIADRVENYKPSEKIDLIVCRAFAQTDKFLKATAHLANSNSRWGLMKSQDNEYSQLENFIKSKVVELKIPNCDFKRVWIEYKLKDLIK